MKILFAFPNVKGSPSPNYPSNAGSQNGGAPQLDELGRQAFHIQGIAAVSFDLYEALQAKVWHVEFGYMGSNMGIARPDLVFNCIGDPALHKDALINLAVVISQSQIPVLNHPWAVLRNSRENNSYLLAKQSTVHVPMTSRYRAASNGFSAHLETHGHTLPVLIQPLGTHGGKGLEKINTPDDFPANIDDKDANVGTYVVSDFTDTVSSDVLYRKYRMIYVNDRLFRRHIIIADDWKVTGDARKYMVGKPELIAEEKSFMEEKSFIEDRGVAIEDRLIHQFRALGLDFGLVDFALSEHGDITIFEINPCFQVARSIPEDKKDLWGYLEENNDEIISALINCMVERANHRD